MHSPKSYETAKAVASIGEAVGWGIVLVAAIGALWAVFNVGLTQGAAIMALGAAVGLIVIATAQILKAQIHTADNTARTADLLERLLATTIKLDGSEGQSDKLNAVSTTAAKNGLIKTYKGVQIYRTQQGIMAGDIVHGGVLSAERWIDQNSKSV